MGRHQGPGEGAEACGRPSVPTHRPGRGPGLLRTGAVTQLASQGRGEEETQPPGRGAPPSADFHLPPPRARAPSPEPHASHGSRDPGVPTRLRSVPQPASGEHVAPVGDGDLQGLFPGSGSALTNALSPHVPARAPGRVTQASVSPSMCPEVRGPTREGLLCAWGAADTERGRRRRLAGGRVQDGGLSSGAGVGPSRPGS